MEIRDACTVRRYRNKAGEDKSAWYKIGTAFLQEDGRVSLQLAALPVNGEIMLFKRQPKEQPQPAPQDLPWED
jgi:hypothetical protein